MSSTIPAAKLSPRVESGTIKWYNGDVFKIKWTVNLTEEGTPIVFAANDKIIFEFFDAETLSSIHVFTFKGTEIVNNTITLDMTADISNKFGIGKYVYCVKFVRASDGRVVTINAKNKVVVEQCH